MPAQAGCVPEPEQKLRCFDSWVAFDAAFTEFEKRQLSLEVVRLAEVPFPPRNDPAGLRAAGLLRGGDVSERKKLLRKALLRWHPDKWQALSSKVPPEDFGRLGELLGQITQELVAQKGLSS